MLFCDLFLLLLGGGEEAFICSDVFFSEPTYNSKTTAEPLTIFVVHAHSEWPYEFLTLQVLVAVAT